MEEKEQKFILNEREYNELLEKYKVIKIIVQSITYYDDDGFTLYNQGATLRNVIEDDKEYLELKLLQYVDEDNIRTSKEILLDNVEEAKEYLPCVHLHQVGSCHKLRKCIYLGDAIVGHLDRVLYATRYKSDLNPLYELEIEGLGVEFDKFNFQKSTKSKYQRFVEILKEFGE